MEFLFLLLQFEVTFSQKPYMTVNNNYIDIYNGRENLCKISSGRTSNFLIKGIKDIAKSNSNLFNQSCPYKAVRNKK